MSTIYCQLVTVTVAGSLMVSACGRGDGALLVDPLMDVFHRRAQEEGLSPVQTEGKRFFTHYCVTCHGADGEGDGQNAYNLDPKPPVFRESLKAHPPSYWRQVIEGGTAAVGRSPLCPPWGRTLSSGQIDELGAYLEDLAGIGAPAQTKPEPSGAR